ncbi:MAG: NADH-quinone oxidoreductase subunit K [Methylacidiphilales bacterium]|nr:NADH-quinone oxidoreductase subunit K [Candidatus Methylacidiphilales bacterium]MDW8349581.1 NADH-quinone oxidoreductase subunit K [Verrucomicrobiae bacterium]
METYYAILIGGLFAAATYLILRRSLLKIILGLILLSQTANVIVFVSPGLIRATAPLIAEGEAQPPTPHADPLPQALILTAIVIGFGVVAFAMALVYRTQKEFTTDDADQIKECDS